jgi:hypothetical protein
MKKLLCSLLVLLFTQSAAAELCIGDTGGGGSYSSSEGIYDVLNCEPMVVHVLGENTSTIKLALDGVALIFGSGGMLDTTNGIGQFGSAVLLPVLISFIGVMLGGLFSQQVRADFLLMIFLLFTVLFVPKMPLAVISTSNGETTLVENIPIGIGFVAGSASMINYKLTEYMGMAFSPIGSDHGNVLVDGFVKPIKELHALKYFSTYSMSDFVQENMFYYEKFCLSITEKNTTGRYDKKVLKGLSGDEALSYKYGSAQVLPGLVVEISYVESGEYVRSTVDCTDAGPVIKSQIEEQLNSASSSGESLAAHWLKERAGNAIATSGPGSLEQAASLISGATKGTAELATTTLLNNYESIVDRLNSMSDGSLSTVDVASYALAMTDSLNADQAAAAIDAEMFLNYMVPAMNMMQFLIIALAPLMTIVMLAAAGNSMKIIGGYLMTGVWVHSWLPAAAVINYWVEESIISKTQNSIMGGTNPVNFFTLGSVDNMYNILASELTVGYKMLSASPIITGMLMTGSTMMMMNLASNLFAQGKGGSQASKLTPQNANVGANHEAKAANSYTKADSASNAVAAESDKMKSNALKMKHGNILSSELTAANQKTAENLASVQSLVKQAGGYAKSSKGAVSYNKSVAEAAGATKTVSNFVSATEGLGGKIASEITDSNREAVKAGLGLYFGGGISAEEAREWGARNSASTVFEKAIQEGNEYRGQFAEELSTREDMQNTIADATGITDEEVASVAGSYTASEKESSSLANQQKNLSQFEATRETSSNDLAQAVQREKGSNPDSVANALGALKAQDMHSSSSDSLDKYMAEKGAKYSSSNMPKAQRDAFLASQWALETLQDNDSPANDVLLAGNVIDKLETMAGFGGVDQSVLDAKQNTSDAKNIQGATDTNVEAGKKAKLKAPKDIKQRKDMVDDNAKTMKGQFNKAQSKIESRVSPDEVERWASDASNPLRQKAAQGLKPIQEAINNNNLAPGTSFFSGKQDGLDDQFLKEWNSLNDSCWGTKNGQPYFDEAKFDKGFSQMLEGHMARAGVNNRAAVEGIMTYEMSKASGEHAQDAAIGAIMQMGSQDFGVTTLTSGGASNASAAITAGTGAATSHAASGAVISSVFKSAKGDGTVMSNLKNSYSNLVKGAQPQQAGNGLKAAKDGINLASKATPGGTAGGFRGAGSLVRAAPGITIAAAMADTILGTANDGFKSRAREDSFFENTMNNMNEVASEVVNNREYLNSVGHGQLVQNAENYLADNKMPEKPSQEAIRAVDAEQQWLRMGGRGFNPYEEEADKYRDTVENYREWAGDGSFKDLKQASSDFNSVRDGLNEIKDNILNVSEHGQQVENKGENKTFDLGSHSGNMLNNDDK